MSIVAYVPDLMDRSKVDAAAGRDVRFVSSPEELADAAKSADMVVVDLSRDGTLEAVEAASGLGVRSIGFCSHTERDLMEQARAAGCDQVLARSVFFGRAGELLG